MKGICFKEFLFHAVVGKGTWNSNSFVWVYDFKLVKQ